MPKIRTYQVEVWTSGALLLRTEATDDLDRARRIAFELSRQAFYQVAILRDDGRSFQSYDWQHMTA